MIDYGRQKSTVKPEEIEITEDEWKESMGHIPKMSDVAHYPYKVTREMLEEGTDSQPGFTGYEFELVGYDKDEYIKLQATSNKSLQEQVETTQEALDFLLFNA